VLDGVGRVVTALARSLSRQGAAVHWAFFHPRNSADVPSRFLASRSPLPDFRLEPDYFRESLLLLSHRHSISWIIPISDPALTALLPLYDELTSLGILLNCPPPSVTRQVLDKNQTLALALECGLPVPREYSLLNTDPASTDFTFPLVAKPLSKRAARQEIVRYFYSRKELLDALAADPPLAESLFQEYCPGTGVGIELLLHNGDPIAAFQHRRIKEFPYTGGVSVVAESEPVDPHLLDLSLRLLRRLNWEGVAMVEFRHDPATRRAALMEVNGRYWGSLPLSLAAGLDFPALQCELLRNPAAIPARPTYRTGVRMRSTSAALSRLFGIFNAWRASKESTAFLLREVAGFFADFGPRTHDAIFQWNDPRPALEEFLLFPRLALRGWKKRFPLHLQQAWELYSQEGLGVAREFLRRRRARLSGLPETERRLPTGTRSILFICSGNIIRSPFAEQVLKQTLGAENQASFRIASAGLHARPGRPADPRAARVAASLGIDLHAHRAQPITPDLIAASDTVIGMDLANEAIFRRRYPGAVSKFRLLGDLSPGGEPIPDPYAGTESDIAAVYARIRSAITALARTISHHSKSRA
jgi:protein-tyrosine-phosphatase/predicted ATP-grasp superfamily ATP-dependent carboligase